MRDAPQKISNWIVGALWHRARLAERLKLPVSPSVGSGLSRLDGALAMATRIYQFGTLRFLISQGADPAVCNWLPMRVVASAGKIELLRHIIDAGAPSAEAFDDARRWAVRHGRPEIAAELDMALSRIERDAISGETPGASRASSRPARL